MSAIVVHEFLERLANLMRNEARRASDDYLQPVQLAALHYLAICNRYSDTPLAVAEYLGLTKGTVSQTLNVLESKGYISKVNDLNDRRVVHLKCNPLGYELLESAIPGPSLKLAWEQLSEPDREKILAALQLLLQTCQRANQMKSFGVCSSCQHNLRRDDNSYFCNLTREPLSQEDVQKICREHIV